MYVSESGGVWLFINASLLDPFDNRTGSFPEECVTSRTVFASSGTNQHLRMRILILRTAIFANIKAHNIY